jgi:NAD(P)H-hydrate repair Nnr-like enzyme with NAD(P)H-hydrate dehydratase domain
MLRPASLANVPFTIAQRGYHSIVVGCGLGTGEEANALVQALVGRAPPVPLVLDADALNLLGENAGKAEVARRADGAHAAPGRGVAAARARDPE